MKQLDRPSGALHLTSHNCCYCGDVEPLHQQQCDEKWKKNIHGTYGRPGHAAHGTYFEFVVPSWVPCDVRWPPCDVRFILILLV